MKTKISLIGVFIAVLAILLLYSGVALAGITDSMHDLRSTSAATIKAGGTATEICVFCHTPHNGLTDGPLWNRKASMTEITYTAYNTILGNSSQPGGASKICLSCHDGTLGTDSLVNVGFDGQPDFSAAEAAMLASSAAIGIAAGDLANDHPVGLTVPGTADYATVSAIETAGLALFTGSETVECSTCHDAHEYGTVAAGTEPFLAKSNLASGLCTTCHLK